jgi:nitrous oxide reductase accessory protein NosL
MARFRARALASLAAAPALLAAARALTFLAVALALAGCSAEVAPPLIRTGTPCASCGMGVEDLHFACERAAGGEWRVYDAIGCMMRDAPGASPRDLYLPDHERYHLHRADSMWVVQGEFQTPMPGSFAAFFGRAEADSFAAAHRGVVGSYVEFAQSFVR